MLLARELIPSEESVKGAKQDEIVLHNKANGEDRFFPILSADGISLLKR